MKIKELHNDIERYLKEDCYCSGEIYSFDGFGYQLFYADQDCERLCERDNYIACVAVPFNKEEYKDDIQIVVFYKGDDDKIVDAIRYDATDNNIKLTKIFITQGEEAAKNSGMEFDEYKKGALARSMREILSLSDGIIIN